MRTTFLGLTALAMMCACGGTDFTLPVGDDAGNDGGGGDGSAGDGAAVDGGSDAGSCLPQEICGNGVDDNCNQQVDEGCNGLGTFVSGATGLDTNPGTKLSPVKTIAKGMANAVTLGGARTVYVAGSHYPEKITLIEGVSLDGGYLCDVNTCTWARNPAVNDTAILDPDFEGVLAGPTITRATTISGFRIQGMNGAPNAFPGAVALTIKGSPSVTGNTINGGDANGGVNRTAAIEVLAPIADPNGPLIENNGIKGGASGASSIGVAFDWAPNPPANSTSTGLVRNNRIVGGTAANVTYGVLAQSVGGSSALVGNSITAGTSNASGGSFGAAWGVGVGGTMLVDANLINVDQNAVGKCTQTALWCGGLVSLGSTSVITNNVIYGVVAPRSAAVLLTEGEKATGVVTLNGNTLDGAGVGISVSGVTISTAVALRIVVGVNGVFGKIRNDILMGGINQKRYGIYEEQIANKTNKPQALEYNDIFFSALVNRQDAYWHQWDGTVASDVITILAPNLNVDPMLDATWHLQSGSGCIDKGTATEAPAKDRDGDNRPKNNVVDMGADEFK